MNPKLLGQSVLDTLGFNSFKHDGGASVAIPVIAAAVQTGGQFAVSGSQGKKTRKMTRELFNKQLEENERNRQYNAEQAALARQWNEDYYNKYMSPEAMARQYKEAGINPYASVGATSSFDTSAGTQTAPVDIGAMSAPYGQLAQNLGSSYATQSQQMSAAISGGFNQAVQAANAYFDLEKKQIENDSLRTQLSRLKTDTGIFDTPLSPEMLDLFPGLESILSRNGKVFSNGLTGHAELSNLTVGQALSLFQYLRPVADFNTSPSGYLPTSDGDAFMRQFYKGIARKHGHDYYKSYDVLSSEDRETAYKTEFGPLLAAFDAIHGSHLSGISSQDFSKWSNDWNKRLMKLGISPNGNSFVDTIARMLGYNMGEQGLQSITGLMNSLGNALSIPADMLNGLVKFASDNFYKRKK